MTTQLFDCDLYFLPGENINISQNFAKFDKIRFNYVQLPISFYNIILNGSINAIPFNITGFFDIPNLLNELNLVLSALIPTIIVSFDFNLFTFTIADVAPITLILNQRTADTLGFQNLINGPALSISSDQLVNISPIRKIYFKISGVKIPQKLMIIKGVSLAQSYNFGFDVSGLEFLTSLNSSAKLAQKIYQQDFVNLEVLEDYMQIKIYDNYDNLIDFSGQSVMLNVTFAKIK